MLDRLRVDQGLDPRLPWGGRSPRVLTKAYEQFRLSLRDDDVNTDFDDALLEEQYMRHRDGS